MELLDSNVAVVREWAAQALERLDRDRVAAQEKVTKREKSINELESKVAREGAKAAASATKEQNRQDAARARQSRRVEGLLSATSSAVEGPDQQGDWHRGCGA